MKTIVSFLYISIIYYRNSTATTLINAHPTVAVEQPSPLDRVEPYRPILDQDEVTEQSLEYFQRVGSIDKDVIIGITADELSSLKVFYQNTNMTKEAFLVSISILVTPKFLMYLT